MFRAGVVSASSCTASGSAISSHSASSADSLVVTAKDSYGNTVTAATDASGQQIGFTANLTGPVGASSQQLVATPNQGLYNGTLNMQAAGNYTLKVAYQGTQISDSPFTVTVSPGAHSDSCGPAAYSVA